MSGLSHFVKWDNPGWSLGKLWPLHMPESTRWWILPGDLLKSATTLKRILTLGQFKILQNAGWKIKEFEWMFFIMAAQKETWADDFYLCYPPALGEKEIERKKVELICLGSSSPLSLLREEDWKHQILKLCPPARSKAMGSVWVGNNQL